MINDIVELGRSDRSLIHAIQLLFFINNMIIQNGDDE